ASSHGSREPRKAGSSCTLNWTSGASVVCGFESAVSDRSNDRATSNRPTTGGAPAGRNVSVAGSVTEPGGTTTVTSPFAAVSVTGWSGGTRTATGGARRLGVGSWAAGVGVGGVGDV